MSVNIGLSDKARKASAEALGEVLANSYALYVKTQNFHWNVTGPLFGTLHEMFAAQYAALALAIDEIAERIRALGHVAPGGLAAFAKHSTVKDAPATPPSAAEMVKALAADHETLVRIARAARDKVEAGGDAESGDLLIERMDAHAKTAWMLRVQV